jgi:hypothetical protein
MKKPGQSPFASPNDEKAVVNYIKLAKSKNVPDAQIKALLKKSNWTDPQISYAFKKATQPAASVQKTGATQQKPATTMTKK